MVVDTSGCPSSSCTVRMASGDEALQLGPLRGQVAVAVATQDSDHCLDWHRRRHAEGWGLPVTLLLLRQTNLNNLRSRQDLLP